MHLVRTPSGFGVKIRPYAQSQKLTIQYKFIRERYHRHKQFKMESQKVAYSKNNKKKRNRHQHNTDDGRQAMGEEMRHVQMSR